jgi:hypothetical protein
MIFTIMGILLMLVGVAISICFWLPGLVNRNTIKAAMGKRYPLVYVIYIANGPMLFLFGLLLIIWGRMQ